ncbi:MAG: DUF1592 domain-containing protein [Lentimonas sp.]
MITRISKISAIAVLLTTTLCSGANTLLPKDAMQPFIEEYCIGCHGPEKEKGDIRLDTISWSLEDLDSAETWEYVLEVLETGEMPPKKKPRPDPIAQQAFMQHLETHLGKVQSASAPAPATKQEPSANQINLPVSDFLAIISKFTPSQILNLSPSKSSDPTHNTTAPETSYDTEPEPVHHELSTAQPTDLDRIALQPFIEKNCIECHGPEKQKGDVRFDTASWRITNNDEAQRWQDVLDVLNGGEMPPEEQPRPNHEELLSTLNSLTKSLVTARKRLTDHGGTITMRRLNRREYVNTIRDLFGVNLSKHAIPEDDDSESFDTIGEEQFFGSIHFDRYLELGTRVAREGFKWSGKPLQKPKATKKQPESITKGIRKSVQKMESQMAQLKSGKSFKEAGFGDLGDKEIFTRQYKGKHGPPSKYLSYPAVDTGQYLFNATRTTDDMSVRAGDDPRAAYRIKIRAGTVEGTPPIRHFLHLQNEQSLGVLKVNGTVRSPQIIEMLTRPEILGTGRNTITITESSPNEIFDRAFNTYLKKIGDDSGFASIWVDWVEVEGPFYPQKSNFFGELISAKGHDLAKANHARELIEKFAYEAFRRKQPEPEYIDGLVGFFEQQMQDGKKYQDAMSETLGIVLASPAFLYIEEIQKAPDNRQISPQTYAVRLAYFLWSAPPDEELYAAAENGSIYDNAVLQKQIRRMLNDPKADAFYKGFMSQWAELDRFEAISVDPKEYHTFSKGLRYSAYKEVIEFFKVLVQENLPVHNLIDSNFVVVNSHLANHYGLTGVNSNTFQKVPIPQNSTRGGFITQTAFLALGSNGERTSPVIRGTMVLDKILNDPPPPPPPNVPELGSESKQPMTNRQMVALHQKQTVCASCHSRIDPIGFGMENYDVIGRWRETEKVGKEEQPIEQGGNLISGFRYRDINDLKRLLKTQKHKLAREMIESMLAYGLGRTIEFSDSEQIDTLVNRCQYDDYGLQTMITKIVTSPLFTTK